MAIQGFDYNYFMSGLLNYVKTNFTGWETKTTADVEKVIANLYPAAADKAAAAQDFYTAYGDTWGLSPNALFNVTEYKLAAALQKTAWAQAQFDAGKFFSLEQAKAAFDTQIAENPYTHYLQVGAALGVNPSNSFDESTFLQNLVTYFKLDMTATDLRTLAIANNITPLAFYVDSVVPVAELAKDITAPPVPTGEQVTPPPPPVPDSFSVAAGAATVAEGKSGAFTVTLSAAQTAATTVEYKLAGTGGAVLGTDTATATTTPGESGILTFAAGETTKTITVPVTFDTAVETGEGVSVTLSAPSTGIQLGTAATAAFTITDPPAPTFTITGKNAAGSDITTTPVQEGSNIVFTITPSGVVDKDTTLTVNMAGAGSTSITNASSADFSASQTITFKAGETAARTVQITVADDSTTEGIEAYKAQLLSGTTEMAKVEGTITDPVSTVTLTGDATVDEGKSATYTLTSDRVAPTGGIVVPYTLSGNATLTTDYTGSTAATGTITIPAGSKTATLVLTAVEDSLTEADAENVIVTLGTPTTSNVVLGSSVAATTVINDTSKGLATGELSLSVSTVSVNEGSDVVYTVTVGTAPTAAINIPYTLSGTATLTADYTGSTATTGNIAIAAGATTGTLTIKTVADNTTETAETLINTLGTLPTGYTLITGKGTTTTTINDTSMAPVANTFTLTTTIDNVTSTHNNVNAVIDQTGTGNNTTWAYSDTVAPAAGSTLNLTLLSKDAVTTSGYNTTGVTTLNIRSVDQASATSAAYGFDLSGLTGLTKVSVANSSVAGATGPTATTAIAGADTFTLNGLKSTTSLDLNTNGQYQNVTVNGADWTGTADTLNMSVTGRTGALLLGTGVETVAITTTGTDARLASLSSNTTATNKTVTVAGTGLKIDGIMDNTITSFDASASNGAVNVYLPTGSILTSAKGGSGSADVLAVNSLATTQTLAGFEKLMAEASATYDLTNAVGVTTLGVDATVGGAVAASFTNAAATQNTISVSGAAQRTLAANATNNLVTGVINYGLKTHSGAADSLTLALDNGGVASTSTTVGTLTLGGFGSTTTSTGIENLTITSADWKAVAFTSGLYLTGSPITGAAPVSVTASGASNFNFNTITLASNGSVVSPDIVNFGAVTGTTSATIADTGSLTFTGGTGVDTIQMGAVTAGKTQTYNLGTGNDAFTLAAGTGTGTTTSTISTTVVNGDAGDDSFTWNVNAHMGTANDALTINGGDGTSDMLVAGALVNGKTLTATISGIEKINLQNTAGVATFALAVAAEYADTLLITDVSGQDNIIGVTSTGNVSLANWTQLGMGASDTVSVKGSGTIKGMGAYATTLTGNTSADIFTGGTGIDTYVISQANSNSTAGIDTISNFVGGTDKLDLAVPANGAGTVNVGSVNADVSNNATAVASTGTTITTLLANLTTAAVAVQGASAGLWAEAGDTMSVKITGASYSGTDVYYVVQNTTADAAVTAGDTIIALIGTSTAAISVATIV